MLREKGAHQVSKLGVQGTMEVLRSPVVAGHLIHKRIKVSPTSPGVRPAGPPRRLPSLCQPFQRVPQPPPQLGPLLPLQAILLQVPPQLTPSQLQSLSLGELLSLLGGLLLGCSLKTAADCSRCRRRAALH